MKKQKSMDLQAPTTKFQPGRYVTVSEAARLIGLPERTLWGWREKAALEIERAGIFVKPVKAVLFDLDAWASYLEYLQREAVEAARAWQLKFRAVTCLPAAAVAAAIAAMLLQGGSGF